MSNPDLTKVKKILHSRLSAVSLGTSDKNGEVDIAPVGSAFLVDDHTIAVLRGPLKKTYKNLQENPEAVFMAVNMAFSKWLKFFLTGEVECLGYRIHTRFREEKEVTEDEKKNILRQRFGIFASSKGGTKVIGTIKKMLVFDIIKVREIIF